MRRSLDPVCQLLALSGAQRGPTHAAAVTPADGPYHEGVQVLQRVAQRGLVAAPPSVNRRQPQRLAEQSFTQLWQEREQSGILEHPGSEVVQHADSALADTFHESGDPKPRVRTQLERVHPGRVDAPQDHVDLLEFAKNSHPYPAVTNRQIAALEQREAEQGGNEGLVEGGFRVRPRAQHHDARVLDRAGRRINEGEAHRLEERGQPMQVGLMIDIRNDPRNDTAILHGESGTGRRLSAI